MSAFELTEDFDLAISSNGLLTLNSGRESVRQHLEVKFQIFFSEWFLDTSIGVPYYQDVFVKRTNFIVVQEVLKEVINETEGVIEILEFNFDYDNTTREASLDFKASTDDGVIEFNQTIEV